MVCYVRCVFLALRISFSSIQIRFLRIYNIFLNLQIFLCIIMHIYNIHHLYPQHITMITNNVTIPLFSRYGGSCAGALGVRGVSSET